MIRFARRPNPSLAWGLGLVAALGAAAIAGAFVGESSQNLAQGLAPPTAAHWLGCDAFGADLGGRLLAGARDSLVVALLVTSLNMGFGLVIGTLAGLAPGGLAVAFTRLIDCFLAFPGLLLAIFLAALLPRSELTIVLALSLTGWAGRARFCRTLARQIADEPHIEAAIASGASPWRVVWRHIWPLMSGQLVVQSALAMGGTILAEASLSFLGLGGTSTHASWGRLIAEGRDYLVEAPHLSVFPGIAFVLAVLAFNLLAEGLRQELQPSQRRV